MRLNLPVSRWKSVCQLISSGPGAGCASNTAAARNVCQTLRQKNTSHHTTPGKCTRVVGILSWGYYVILCKTSASVSSQIQSLSRTSLCAAGPSSSEKCTESRMNLSWCFFWRTLFITNESLLVFLLALSLLNHFGSPFPVSACSTTCPAIAAAR